MSSYILIILGYIVLIIVTILISEYYKNQISKNKTEYDKTIKELLDNTKNQLIEKDHECMRKQSSLEKYYNNLLIDNIFDLYQASLVIRKYNIHKYEIDVRKNEVHIYCTMQTYTKMSIGKEILPNIKYHINGTNVVL